MLTGARFNTGRKVDEAPVLFNVCFCALTRATLKNGPAITQQLRGQFHLQGLVIDLGKVGVNKDKYLYAQR